MSTKLCPRCGKQLIYASGTLHRCVSHDNDSRGSNALFDQNQRRGVGYRKSARHGTPRTLRPERDFTFAMAGDFE
ncbi:MAG: hypothetical protein KGL39_48765 [Patescibacteria group bacterium]|nr:hypothetical protein [Patescibacteria group bacterium]